MNLTELLQEVEQAADSQARAVVNVYEARIRHASLGTAERNVIAASAGEKLAAIRADLVAQKTRLVGLLGPV